MISERCTTRQSKVLSVVLKSTSPNTRKIRKITLNLIKIYSLIVLIIKASRVLLIKRDTSLYNLDQNPSKMNKFVFKVQKGLKRF